MRHFVKLSTRSDIVIASIHARRDVVRYWFAANGALVGVWRAARRECWYAIGHDREGRVIAYRAMTPPGWDGGAPTLHQAAATALELIENADDEGGNGHTLDAAAAVLRRALGR